MSGAGTAWCAALRIASLLRCACPGDAGRFALAVHERLCERGDHEHAGVWLNVIDCLASDALEEAERA